MKRIKELHRVQMYLTGERLEAGATAFVQSQDTDPIGARVFSSWTNASNKKT